MSKSKKTEISESLLNALKDLSDEELKYVSETLTKEYGFDISIGFDDKIKNDRITVQNSADNPVEWVEESPVVKALKARFGVRKKKDAIQKAIRFDVPGGDKFLELSQLLHQWQDRKHPNGTPAFSQEMLAIIRDVILQIASIKEELQHKVLGEKSRERSLLLSLDRQLRNIARRDKNDLRYITYTDATVDSVNKILDYLDAIKIAMEIE